MKVRGNTKECIKWAFIMAVIGFVFPSICVAVGTFFYIVVEFEFPNMPNKEVIDLMIRSGRGLALFFAFFGFLGAKEF